MATQSVFLDDFSAMVQYSPYSSWLTNNATNQLWSNTSYFEGTYHQTTSVGAAFTLVTSMLAVSIFGSAGPAFGAFQVEVDGVQSNQSASASTYSPSQLVYSNPSLSRGTHNLTVTNLGDGFVLDYIELTVVAGAQGATLQNTTIDQNNTRVSYPVPWTTDTNLNTNPIFVGGSTAFTNQSLSASLDFNGSCIYLIGDHLNDHGPFVVTLDGVNTTLQGRVPTPNFKDSVMFFASDLSSAQHRITVTNIASLTEGEPGISSFFDLDAFIVTAPTAFADASNSSASSPSGSSSPSAATPSPSATRSAAQRTLSTSHLVLCMSGLLAWLLLSAR